MSPSPVKPQAFAIRYDWAGEKFRGQIGECLRSRRLAGHSARGSNFDGAFLTAQSCHGWIETMPEHDPQHQGRLTGHSRRDFLRGSSLAAATAVLTGRCRRRRTRPSWPTSGPTVLSGQVRSRSRSTARTRQCTVEPRSTLLDTLRNRLDVTGPKRVCDRASCGACTTIIDGDAVYSCTTLAVSCQGKTIETLESFDTGEKGVPHAFHQNDGLMCGYCTPGFVTACKALLRREPEPDARGGPQGARRQHLSLRHVHRCPPGGAGRGQSDERSLIHGQLGPRIPA